MATDLPDCGIYRTGVSMPGHEEEVPGGSLVYFHNHSDKGPPLVLPPAENVNNTWSFAERGWLCEDPGFIAALVPLKPQGYYVIGGRHLHLSKEEIIAERTLVQLGYNRRGDSILFVAQFEGNTISFPERGYRFEAPSVQQHLEPVNFNVPAPATGRVLH